MKGVVGSEVLKVLAVWELTTHLGVQEERGLVCPVNTEPVNKSILELHTTTLFNTGKYSNIQVFSKLIQWDLSIKDTLRPGNLSTVERLFILQR